MKIGIILSPYGTENPSGLSVYILNLSLEIVKQAPEHSFKIFVRGGDLVEEFESFKNVEIEILPDTIFWKDIAYLSSSEVDIWLYNNLGLPFFFKPRNSVSIALDFGIFYDFEKTLSKRSLAIKVHHFLQGRALKTSARVVCISGSTQADLFRFFPKVDTKKVLVSMSGYSPPSADLVAADIANLPESFYLLAGVIKPRKNQITAVKAFIKAKEEGLDSDLVITGKGAGNYFASLMSVIHNSKYEDCIHYRGYSTSEEMLTLFKRARALIIPSKVEGFGMLVVEAMSCGTPVIISTNPALVEVAGGAAIISEVDSVEGYAKAMHELRDSHTRDSLIEKGLEQAKKFSWKKSALEYLRIMSDLQTSLKD